MFDFKQRELLNFIAVLSQKNEHLPKISNGLEKLVLLSNGEFKELIVSNLSNLKSNLEVNKFNIYFCKKFMELNQDFAITLSNKLPKITPMELKVSALIRLQIGTKEVAKMLDISLRTVENNCFALRRKFNLAKGERLAIYLTKI